MEPVTIGTIVAVVEKCVSLFDALHKSYKKHADLDKKIESTKNLLDLINATIQKQQNQSKSTATYDDQVIRSWTHGLEAIKRQIENSMDNFNFNVRFPANKKKSVEGVIPAISAASKAAFKHPADALLNDIEHIHQEINKFTDTQKLFEVPLSQDGESNSNNTYHHRYEHPTVKNPRGLETSEDELVQLMRKEDSKLAVAIYGPSGSGKSVLANEVYTRVKSEFGFCAQVKASCKPKDLLKKVITEFEFALPQVCDNPDSYLKDLLLESKKENKRCIIKIEELEDTNYWDNFKSAFDDDNISVRFIVTTRTEEVAKHLSTKGCTCTPYRMMPLHKQAAQELLEEKAFHPESKNNRPDAGDKLYIEGLTKVLEICEYLPVAIADVGTYLGGVVLWWDVKRSGDFQEDIGGLKGMKHVFDRSYTSLSYTSQTCLLSLISTCPNGKEVCVIKRKSVIRRWLAERLIEEKETDGGSELFGQMLAQRLGKAETDDRSVKKADRCFTELMNHNFIIPMEVSLNGKVKTFRVHRMMLPFIKAISRNSVFHLGQEMKPSAHRLRHCQIHNSNTEHDMTREAIDLSDIRLLTFHGTATKTPMKFKSTKFLRVLVLENIKNLKDDDLGTFCCPSILKYLSIRGSTCLSKLPEDIVELQMLETLDTRDTNVHEIPMKVILLPELMHLFGEFQITGMEEILQKKFKLKKWVEKITDKLVRPGGKRERAMKAVSQQKRWISIKDSKLQTLAGFIIAESSLDFVTFMPDMPKLSKVRILCRQSDPSEKVLKVLQDSLKKCFEKKLLAGNLQLHSLSIDFRGFDLNFLGNLTIQPPSFLHSLKLCGKLAKLPDFIKSPLSDSLKELYLSRTNLTGSVLKELGSSLKKLQFLKLTEGPSFKFESELTFESAWFDSLERLCFNVPNLPKIAIKMNALKGLKSLQLFCTTLGGVSGISHLDCLEEVIVPSKDRGEVDDFLQKVREHHKKPKLILDAGGLGV